MCEFENGLCIYLQSIEDSMNKSVLSFQSLEHDHTKIDCPICLDIVPRTHSIVSKCKHAVCIDCCQKMINNNCPICRETFSGKSKWGYWNHSGKWIDFEHIMLQNIKISKKRLKKISYFKTKKKYREHYIKQDFHLAKSRALVAAILF